MVIHLTWPLPCGPQELADLGLGDWGEDVFVGLWAGPRERYAMREEASAESIRAFVEV